MKLHEIDWRHNSISKVLDTLSDELTNVANEINPDEPESGLELTNSLMGIAFVTAQVYIAGTVSDAKKLLEPFTVTKANLLKDFSKQIPGSEITEIELCDALANYFKHHDEWSSDWSFTNQNKVTIGVLRSVGLDHHDSYPCILAADILFFDTLSPPSHYLSALLSMIVEWRRKVMNGLDSYR